MFDKWFELNTQQYSEADAEWDDFIANHPQGSLLQTTHWARLKNRFGWSSKRVWLRRDGELVAGAQILFRGAALGIVKIGYIPHGPLVNWEDEEQVQVLLNQIDHAAYRHGAGLVKMEPLLWQDEVDADVWSSLCRRHGLAATSETIQPPQTIIVDLRPSEEEILAGMKQKTRYNIRLSARKGVTVREGTAADLPAFNQMMFLTGRRDGFGVHAPDYYKHAYDLFAPDNAALLMAEYEGQPLAAVMVFAVGRRAAYLFGASSNAEKQRMPSYAAQWAAIRWAKARGCTEYDLWGIPDADTDTLEANFTQRHEGLWGVYRFKRGFGGRIRRTVGMVDRVYNKRVERLYRWRRRRAGV